MKFSLCMIFPVLLAAAACTSPVKPAASTVHSYYDKKTDFKQYTTFAFAFDGDKKISSPEELDHTLFKAQIEIAISYEMQGNGYTMQSQAPDLVIFYQVFHKDIDYSRKITLPQHYGVQGDSHINDDHTTHLEVGKGTLMVQLYDPVRKEIIWQGMASGIMDGGHSNENAMIQRAVNSIFNQYAYRTRSFSSR